MSPNRSPQKNQTVVGYCTKIATGFFSLLQGMRLTLSYLVDPRKVVTQQYPENRETLDIFPRFRGRLTMVINETGGNNCTGCGLCEKACPNGTISVLNTKDAAGKKILGQYIYRFLQCTLCNLCVETCPFGAITMGQEFELATYDRDSLVLVLNEEEGRTNA